MTFLTPRLADFNFAAQQEGCSPVSNPPAFRHGHFTRRKQIPDILQNARRMAVNDADQLYPLALRRFYRDIREGETPAAADFDCLSRRGPADMNMQIAVKAAQLRF
ncbi:hypothetical protein D3C73_1316370 [compost metagenome]